MEEPDTISVSPAATAGTEATRRFYDDIGWRVQDGKFVDSKLFGASEVGPIRIELHRLHVGRIRSALSQAGAALNLLECGCGGNPAKLIMDLCSRYTGVDFSERGIALARASSSDAPIKCEFQKADCCALPFNDGAFDAVVSQHMIYHIDSASAQEAAIAEMARVVRTGGVVAIVTANPYPLAFPVRLIRGLVRDAPLLGSLFNLIRSKPPLPFKPMPIGWMRRRLGRFGPVEIVGTGMATTYFNQKVTEFNGIGKLGWTVIRWLETNYPRLSAYLGSYAMLVCRKSG